MWNACESIDPGRSVIWWSPDPHRLVLAIQSWRKGDVLVLGSILIGLDTAEHGAVLAEFGRRWAARTGATLVGLGIVDEPGIRAIKPAWAVGGSPGKDPVYYMGYEPRLAEIHQRVGQLLEQFGRRCNEAGVAHIERKLVGTPHDLIAAESQSCDLVALRGSHFRFTAQDDDGTEMLRKVLKVIPRPIVLVPETSVPPGPVAIAYDGSLQAAPRLVGLPGDGIGRIRPGRHHQRGHERRRISAPHGSRREFLGFHKIDAAPIVVESSAAPAKVILEQCEHLGAGLLVMGAYGQPTLREFVVGSVTRTILEEGSIPVLLFH